MVNDQGMSTVERRRIILEELRQNKQIYIPELNRKLGVSEVTIRKDLKYLEKKNLLIRSRGGAMMTVKVGDDLSVEERKILNLAQKKLIAAAAASLIKEGDTIIIDSGTTLMQFARLLKNFKELTIITNALDIAVKLSESKHLKIIVPGGVFRHKSFSLVGVTAFENFRMYRADKYFVSADGINSDGLYTSNLEEGQIAKMIMSYAKENIVLVDSGKFDRTGTINFAPLSKINTLVTDNKIPKSHYQHLTDSGIRVILATANEKEQ